MYMYGTGYKKEGHLKKGAFDCQPSLQSLEALNLCTRCTTLGSSYIVSLKAGQDDKIVFPGDYFFSTFRKSARVAFQLKKSDRD